VICFIEDEKKIKKMVTNAHLYLEHTDGAEKAVISSKKSRSMGMLSEFARYKYSYL
jgi:hypothetical protein